MRTEQEAFWYGSFGEEYTDRNAPADNNASNIFFFAQALKQLRSVRSVFEIGTNRGLNLCAMRSLMPNTEFSGIEINEKAAELARRNHPSVLSGSILDVDMLKVGTHDLVLTKGVLIHITPERVFDVYSRIASAANKYVLIAEYYNPTPVEITYRGHSDKLFKRDFAGEFMQAHNFSLLDYGFAYRGDPNYPQDDLNWFLLEKGSPDPDGE
jgi:pseudaminic acid biosynthesis-associated methylase